MKLTIKFIDSMFKYGIYGKNKNNSISYFYSERESAEKAIAEAEEFYLSYVNDYLSISVMAEDYNMTETQVEQLINLGRYINNN